MSNVTALKPRPALADEVWLSPAQVAERVPGITVGNLKDLRANGRGPAYHRPTGEHGKTVIYAQSDVDAWVARSRVETRDQP